MGQMIEALKEYRVPEADVIIRGSSPAFDENVRNLQAAAARLAKTRAEYEPLIVKGTDDEKFMKEFDAAWAYYQKSSARVVDLVRAGERDAIIELYFGDNCAAFDAAAEALVKDAAFNEFNEQHGKKAADAGEDAAADAELVQRAVNNAGLAVIRHVVKTREPFVEALETFQPDIVLSDYGLVDNHAKNLASRHTAGEYG